MSHASRPRTVLVTGATSGIGLTTVGLLAHGGFRVLAGTRRPVADFPWGDWPAGAVVPLTLDVADAGDCQQLPALLAQCCPEGLFALVNNAGQGAPAAVELTTPEELEQLLAVNVVGPLRVIRACLPALRAAQGRIVNISSMNGKVSLPMVGAYSASKFALEALSDALRVELRPWGVTVSVIRPGQVRTAIFEKARVVLRRRSYAIPPELADGYAGLYARAARFNDRGADRSSSPQTVARAVQRALAARRPRARYTVGADAWGLALLQAALPTRWFDALLAAVAGVGSTPPAGAGALPQTVDDPRRADVPLASADGAV